MAEVIGLLGGRYSEAEKTVEVSLTFQTFQLPSLGAITNILWNPEYIDFICMCESIHA